MIASNEIPVLVDALRLIKEELISLNINLDLDPMPVKQEHLQSNNSSTVTTPLEFQSQNSYTSVKDFSGLNTSGTQTPPGSGHQRQSSNIPTSYPHNMSQPQQQSFNMPASTGWSSSGVNAGMGLDVSSTSLNPPPATFDPNNFEYTPETYEAFSLLEPISTQIGTGFDTG